MLFDILPLGGVNTTDDKILHFLHCKTCALFLTHPALVFFNFSASREKSYKQIEAAIAKYRETKENINEGLKFYVTLQV